MSVRRTLRRAAQLARERAKEHEQMAPGWSFALRDFALELEELADEADPDLPMWILVILAMCSGVFSAAVLASLGLHR